MRTKALLSVSNMKPKTYLEADKAYEAMLGPLASFASRHLARKDEKFDVVHEVFRKLLKYREKKPKSKISVFLLYRETIRECRRRNQATASTILSDMNYEREDRPSKLLSDEGYD